MVGTAPTDFHFTRTLDAGPVHCSVWFYRRPYRRSVRSIVVGQIKSNAKVAAVVAPSVPSSNDNSSTACSDVGMAAFLELFAIGTRILSAQIAAEPAADQNLNSFGIVRVGIFENEDSINDLFAAVRRAPTGCSLDGVLVFRLADDMDREIAGAWQRRIDTRTSGATPGQQLSSPMSNSPCRFTPALEPAVIQTRPVRIAYRTS